MPEQILLPENVADAIRQNLPEQIGKVLRDRLEEADKAIKSEALLKDQLLDARKQIWDQEQLQNKEKALEKLETELAAKGAALNERERALDITVLEIKYQAEARVGCVLKDTLLGLVRNTVYRENKGFSSSVQTYGYGEHQTAIVQPGSESNQTQAE